jgi:hypothetical protein
MPNQPLSATHAGQPERDPGTGRTSSSGRNLAAERARSTTLQRARKLARSHRSRVRQPGGIKGRRSCGVCSGFRTEQGKSGEDLLQVHHLARYELGDGEGDNLGRTVDVGDHAVRFCSGEATAVGAQTQLDLVRVECRRQSGWPPSWRRCRRASPAVARWWTVERQG